MTKTFPTLGVCLLLLVACSSNRLARYELTQTSVAAHTVMPVSANVFTNLDLNIDPDNVIRSVIRVGTSVAREVEAERARARLDSAMAMVDVSAIIEEGVLFQAAEMMNFRPVNEVQAADFIFHIVMKRYGIDARSWNGGMNFIIDARIELIDNVEHRRIWKGRVDASEPLTSGFFGHDSTISNVLDAMALSRLSVEEISTGLAYLASYSADLITEKLYRDFIRSRK
ncbi:hypothetical protein ACFL44_03520 [Gemmatimonadota bacterium]